MPATDHFWRNVKTMHKVFAVSSAILLVAFIWMMFADHDDEFRDYQRTYYKLQALKYDQELKEKKDAKFDAALKAAKRALEKEEAALAEKKARDLEGEERSAEELADQISDVEFEVSQLSRKLKNAKSYQNLAVADKNLAVTQHATDAEIAELKERFKEEGQKVEALRVQLENRTADLQTLQASYKYLTGPRDEARKEVERLENEIAELLANREQVQPKDDWLQRTKRAIMEMPIIDGFNGHIAVEEDWLPDLPIKLGMAETARFDRCRTCHMGIDAIGGGGVPKYPHGEVDSDEPEDWVAANKFPHPYSAHPNLDLYCTANSPHPVTTFGCTICHEGAGSATTFHNAQHMPSNPVIEEEWAEEYGFFANHFWEYPMHTERFIESSCIKCHHNVTELAVNEEWGATAPKVHKGYRLIQEYGCFGCHEIHGYDGETAIGPDLRAEPPTETEAYYAARRNVSGGGLLPEETPTAEQWKEIQALIPEITGEALEHPGKLRKVGPALTHIGEKVSRGWLEHWIRNPKEFRPSTKMPRFYDLANQHDELAAELQPVEVAGIAQYLLSQSEMRNREDSEGDVPSGIKVGTPLETMTHAEDYEPDAERGKTLFAQRGCLACHSQPADEEFAGIEQDFGPELSKIHLKLKAGQAGFDWLYTWLKNPSLYHPRTRMPIVQLDVYAQQGETVDPAADIAAYLLKDAPEESAYDVLDVDDASLDKLVALHLSGKSLTESQTQALLYGTRDEEGNLVKPATRDYPLLRETLVKSDEFELTLPGDQVPDEETWKKLKLSYIGKRTISRYGCYACHSIPGYEDSRPIGVALQDWGRKDPTKLALEHIEEYLHHHGEEPDHSAHGHGADDHHGHDDDHGSLSTYDRAVRAVKMATSGEFTSEEEREEELDVAYYYDQLLHHGRPGFIWQKLRQPRSYDYKMTDTKGWDERLRMPRFTFSLDDDEDDDAREAIATFVLGLVAEPPPEPYIYEPDPDAETLIRGEQLLAQYNCTGCHAVELDTQVAALDPDDILGSFTPRKELFENAESGANGFHGYALDLLLDKIKPPMDVDVDERTMVEIDGEEEEALVVRFKGIRQNALELDVPFAERETSFALWTPLRYTETEADGFGGETQTQHVMLPNKTIFYPGARHIETIPGHGGTFAYWLVDHLAQTLPGANPKEVWQLVPPPLDVEGHKVQTPWLYNFLLEPYKIRPMTVLRMPKYNFSPTEARALANYFAAKSGTPYPYQDVEARDPAYIADRVQEFEMEDQTAYLHETWKVLQAKECIACHSIGTRLATPPAKAAVPVQGPNLEIAGDRLQADYTNLWIARPEWILPYTGMKIVWENGKPTSTPKLFGGDAKATNIAARDALLNFHYLAQRYPGETYEPEGTAGAAPEGGADENATPAGGGDGDEENSPQPQPPRTDQTPGAAAPPNDGETDIETPPNSGAASGPDAEPDSEPEPAPESEPDSEPETDS